MSTIKVIPRKDGGKIVWKDVIGYEGLYMISNNGQVKSLKRTNKMRKIKEDYLMKIHKSLQGYMKVFLCKDNKQKSFFVHRLVALSFLDNQEEKLYVNHKDGNKVNNDVSNLEWVSSCENAYHAHKKGLNHKNRHRLNAFEYEILWAAINGGVNKELLCDNFPLKFYESILSSVKSKIGYISARKKANLNTKYARKFVEEHFAIPPKQDLWDECSLGYALSINYHPDEHDILVKIVSHFRKNYTLQKK